MNWLIQNTMDWTKKNALLILITVSIGLFVRFFLFQVSIVNGESMMPNFKNNEIVIVNRLNDEIPKIKRGDVIVFDTHFEKKFIKRVLALPGDYVQVINDSVYVNYELIDESYLKKQIEQSHKNGYFYNGSKNFPVAQVPKDHLFVLGDNRSDSLDSRFEEVGMIPIDNVIGTVIH